MEVHVHVHIILALTTEVFQIHLSTKKYLGEKEVDCKLSVLQHVEQCFFKTYSLFKRTTPLTFVCTETKSSIISNVIWLFIIFATH